MRRLCVYCGSRPGRLAEYRRAGRELARAMSARGIGLVYGGASIGVMGEVADALLEAGGEVIGVIPQSLLQREIAHPDLSELHVTDSMHERKSLMAELADGFVALPGGLGTLEEIFEVLTWAQLGFHVKPCGLINTLGYYDHLIAFLDHTLNEQFVHQQHRDLMYVDVDPARVVETLIARVG